MPEIVVRGVSGDFFQISQDAIGVLNREIPEKAAIVFPKLEVGHLGQVFHQ
jgi:hypothetical protein